ncbi:hypothetical protein P8H27_02280 [Pseudomonas sp. sp1636]|uniref:hypothetical protein n=1 Tax=Pseudomonas sp. sp1636 TaxID=3036707 RepID=UPI0025A6722F|nr:hypothetical protein [Pseudomonas sp. sp1636]MDM8347723.1 hypothetical protein [Pseudomonas sp. sp1636]
MSNRILPIMAATREMIFTQEIQNDRQIATSLTVIVNQQNFRFTPHMFDLILGANGSALCRTRQLRWQLAASKINLSHRVNFMA